MIVGGRVNYTLGGHQTFICISIAVWDDSAWTDDMLTSVQLGAKVRRLK